MKTSTQNNRKLFFLWLTKGQWQTHGNLITQLHWQRTSKKKKMAQDIQGQTYPRDTKIRCRRIFQTQNSSNLLLILRVVEQKQVLGSLYLGAKRLLCLAIKGSRSSSTAKAAWKRTFALFSAIIDICAHTLTLIILQWFAVASIIIS